METTSRVALIAERTTLTALALFVSGPLLVHLLGVPPLAGFYTFGIGLLLGLVALLLGLLGLFLTRPATGRGGRGRSLLAVGVGAPMLVAVVSVNARGIGAPPINDITTNVDDPPTYVAIRELQPERDYSYPGAAFADAQRIAYPDLATIELARSPEQAFADARRAADALGWEVVGEEPESGRLEATDTSVIFEFVDDVVVRIRPSGAGSVIDVRSKSRDGRGDVGVNSGRIRAFRDVLSE